ncbi:MAG: contact-dependent growth inhibition system immunity protein [Myxococcota bacterium]
MLYFATRDERLRQFFGAYFNQDWELDDPDVPSVVDRYARDYEGDELDGESVIGLLVKDLRWLVETHGNTSSDDLWRITCDQYHSYYNGKYVDQDAHQWLQWVAKRLENHLKKQGK